MKHFHQLIRGKESHSKMFVFKLETSYISRFAAINVRVYSENWLQHSS